MQKLPLSIIVLCVIFSGCAGDDTVIINNSVPAVEDIARESDASEASTKEVASDDEKDVNGAATDGAEESKEFSGDIDIIDRFITWGFTPAQRTSAQIDTVIVHSVYNPFREEKKHSLDEVLNIFKDYGVAPHYIIGRSGKIYQTVDESDVAWHAGRSRVPDGRTRVNDFSIGIEMINSLDDTYTDAQYASLRALIQDIDQRHSLKYVLGHDEIEVEDPWNFDWSHINDLRHEAR